MNLYSTFNPLLQSSQETHIHPNELTRFARGFLFGEKSENTTYPQHWVENQFHGMTLATDPRVNLGITDTVVLLGLAIDVISGNSDLQHISNDLARALKTSRTSFQNLLNTLSGRFVVISFQNGEFKVQTDSTGMRTVFFTEPPLAPMISSHENLLSQNQKLDLSVYGNPNYLKENYLTAMPGRTTKYANVKALTPNTEIDMLTAQCRRVFDGKGFQVLNTPTAARNISRDIKNQIPALLQENQISLSLTAGLDSRATLAMLRNIKEDIDCFTYEFSFRDTNKANRYDVTAASEISKKFDLNHRIIDITSPDLPHHIKKDLMEISNRSHARALANAYLEEEIFGLHIRSNLYEIGRSQYLLSEHGKHDIDAKAMLNIASNNRSKDKHALAAFEEFIQSTDFYSIENISLHDAYFWEYRLSRWLSPVMLESDIAHNTHTVINSRKTLLTFLSVDLESRKKASLFLEIIRQEWPELLSIPINGTDHSGFITTEKA